MKRAAFILLGALLCGVAGYLAIALATRIHELHFAKSQDDMSQFAGMLVIVVFPLSLALGGWLGHLVCNRFAREPR